MSKITAWSFSRYNCYVECPRKAKYKFVDRLQEPGSEAMDRGAKLHSEIEKYLRDGGRQPACVKPMKGDYQALRALKPAVELELAYDSGWNRVDWFAKNCWVRIKVDALVPPVIDDEAPTVRVIDHKSGKVKEHGEYDEQLELYGLAGLITYPTAVKSTGELFFIDHGVIVGAQDEFLRKDEKKLKKKWETRVKKMMTDTVFKPKPGNACRWCHFRKSNGGPCEF